MRLAFLPGPREPLALQTMVIGPSTWLPKYYIQPVSPLPSKAAPGYDQQAAGATLYAHTLQHGCLRVLRQQQLHAGGCPSSRHALQGGQQLPPHGQLQEGAAREAASQQQLGGKVRAGGGGRYQQCDTRGHCVRT